MFGWKCKNSPENRWRETEMKTKPMIMLLAMLASWIDREQQQIIEYLKAENYILKEELLKATR